MYDLAATLDELAGPVDDHSLATWNEHPDRTLRHVLSTPGEAARAARRRQAHGEPP
jgi:hypothetical protein